MVKKIENNLTRARDFLIRVLYKTFVKNTLFLIDSEKVHERSIKAGKFLGRHKITKNITRSVFSYSNPDALGQNIFGIKFPNPIGLAAGFDKNAELTDILPDVGFGFAEVGSITGEPCKGNPKPRLWRLKKSKSIVVNYGLKNDGCEKISKRLKNKKFEIPIGISIAKTNSRETREPKEGIYDYLKAYKHFSDIGNYLTINISCPNAYGGQPFTNQTNLGRLLAEIEKIRVPKPILLKLPPDLRIDEIDEIIDIARKYRIAGFICSNLTKYQENSKIKDKILEKRIPGAGGISGKVIEELSNDQINYIYRKTRGEFVIVGCGGVFCAEDAYKKIKAGASLIQLITGMIFEGPQLISEINQGLVGLLKKDGLVNISQAIGMDN